MLDKEQRRVTAKNEFFDPSTCGFDVYGFMEELEDPVTRKSFGARRIEMPDRPTGSPGRKEFTLTQDTCVVKSGKDLVLKASPKRPRKVVGTIVILCGRVSKKTA